MSKWNFIEEGGTYGCIFSGNRKHRYALWRIWDEKKPCILFIGLNPSTADEKMDDPTIRRVRGFAEAWGYGGVYMMNLFSFITPYPNKIKKDDIIENDNWLETIRKLCPDVLFAWGDFKGIEERVLEIHKMFPKAYCLGYNKSGSPKHPLYIKSSTKKIIYEP